MVDDANSDSPPIWSHPVRVADLARKREITFDLQPSPEVRAAIAVDLGLSALKKMRMKGKVAALGRHDWRLTAEIGATFVQPCVVTLDPVTTRIDEIVERNFLKEMPEYEAGSETEMLEDESSELLGPEIDLGAVMVEALALAIPLFPRSDGSEMADLRITEPGKTPLTDEETKPFAALGQLRDKLAGDAGDEG